MFFNATHPVQTLSHASSKPEKTWFAFIKASFSRSKLIAYKGWRKCPMLRWMEKIKTTEISSPDEKLILLAIRPEKIQHLLANRHICAADLHPLDMDSKKCVRFLCLHNCVLTRDNQSPLTD